jgi:hypothetical protein
MVQLSDMKNIIVSKIIATFICELLLDFVVYCIQNTEATQLLSDKNFNLIRYIKS